MYSCTCIWVQLIDPKHLIDSVPTAVHMCIPHVSVPTAVHHHVSVPTAIHMCIPHVSVPTAVHMCIPTAIHMCIPHVLTSFSDPNLQSVQAQGVLLASKREQETELRELRQNKELLGQWEKQIADIIQWVTEEKDARAYLKSVAKKLADDVETLKTTAGTLGRVSFLLPLTVALNTKLNQFYSIYYMYMYIHVVCLMCIHVSMYLHKKAHHKILPSLCVCTFSPLQQKEDWMERRTLKRDKQELLELELSLKNEVAAKSKVQEQLTQVTSQLSDMEL